MILSSSLCGNTKLPAKSGDRHHPVTPCFRITWWDQQPVCFLARGPSVLDSEPHGEQAHTRFLFFCRQRGRAAAAFCFDWHSGHCGAALIPKQKFRKWTCYVWMCLGAFPPLCVFKITFKEKWISAYEPLQQARMLLPWKYTAVQTQVTFC